VLHESCASLEFDANLGKHLSTLLLPSLHCTTAGGFVDCIESLLRHRANIDSLDERGCSALLRALAAGHADAARMLLSQGADARLVDAVERRSALHWASHHGMVEVALQLMEAGKPTDVDVEDAKG
jgi:ankyrin repeat protein